MEASVVTPPAAEPEQSHDGEAEATRSTPELFRWSGYVHVGHGAEECEGRVDGSCADPAHFHAWVCLPNSYQIRDVQEKARAARARKVRALRDTSSDSGAILEGELDDIRRDQMDQLVVNIAQREVDSALIDIVRDVQGREEFENQNRDAEDFRRLQLVGEENMTTEEAEDFQRLQQQMLDYGSTMQEIIDKRRDGEIARLKALDPGKLIDMEREFRIRQIADEAFLHTYYTWVIFVGTREPSTAGFSSKRKFREATDQRDAAPEVVLALREKIRQLEGATTKDERGDAAGNS